MPFPVKNRRYQGYTTVTGDGLHALFDIDLVNQDLANNFNTKKGEVITDPTYGSIIWSKLFEPATQANMNIMRDDTMRIFNNEPRVSVVTFQIIPSTFPNLTGFTLQAQLNYIGLQVAGPFTANFFSSLVDTGV